MNKISKILGEIMGMFIAALLSAIVMTGLIYWIVLLFKAIGEMLL